ncbi:MAG: BREX-3 system P-loop-containing protein BrxF [Cyanobacteria bacterium J06554_11]
MVADAKIPSSTAGLASLLVMAKDQYHQLLIWHLPADSSTEAVDRVAKELRVADLNLNLELSRRLLELPQRQWPHQVSTLLRDIIKAAGSSGVLLSHIELLFDKGLRVDPMRCLQQVARHQPVIAIWPGEVSEQYLLYAEPDHPEYMRYPRKDYLVFSDVPLTSTKPST